MPYPPPRTPSGPRRRSLLASAAGAALLVGCSAGPDSAAGNAPSAAARARARAARDSEGLLARYDAVLAAHPALARPLGPLRAQVAAHRAAFADRAAASPSAGPASPASGATSGATSGAASSPALAVPAGEKDALAFLATAERGLADRRAKELLDVPGELARLLASAAAAGAAHAYLLTEEAK
ncbi:hypothetical protein ACF09I_03875 [Streptomyces sp. NPDC014940]|uniref:hypothetical protein n=1 Tax=Streptomyces sp. NPDC014940 TaxID=3364932 RepID=UPI0036FE9C5B